MQRLARYPLLLDQVMRYTPAGHMDHGALVRAHEGAVGLLERTEAALSRAEIEDHANFDLGARPILRDGTVAKAKSNRPVRLVLTPDMLLLLSDNRLYRLPTPLTDTRARLATADSWALAIADERPLKFKSRDAREWVHAINYYRDKLLR